MQIILTVLMAFALAAATTIPAETTHVTKFCHYKDPQCCPKDHKCWLVDDAGVPLDSAHNDTAGDPTDASAFTAAELYLLPSGITVCAGQDAEKCCPPQNRLCAILATDAVKVEAVGYFWHASPDVTVADLAEEESDAPSSGVALARRGNWKDYGDFGTHCTDACPFWCAYSVRCLKNSLRITGATLGSLLTFDGRARLYQGLYGGRGGLAGGLYGGRGGLLGGAYGGRGGLFGDRGYSRQWPKPAFGMSGANSANVVAANDNGGTHSCEFYCPARAMWCFCPSWCQGECSARLSDHVPVSATSGLDTASTFRPSNVSTTSSLDTVSTSRPIDVSAKVIRAIAPRGAPKTKPSMTALTTPIPYEEPDCPAICRPNAGCFCPAHCRACYIPPSRSKAKPATISSPGQLGAEDWEPCVLTFYREAAQPIGRTATEYKRRVTVTTSIDCRGCAATTRVITFPAPTPTAAPSTTMTRRKTTSTVTVCVDNTQGMTCGVDLTC